MKANPINCPMKVDIDGYFVAAEVVTSTPRIRLANVADMEATLARRSSSTASLSRFNCSAAVCNGVKRFKPQKPGRVYVYAVYCRNDLALSEVTGWTNASAPDDARMGDLMKDLFNVVFDRSPYSRRQHGHGSMR